MSTITIQKTETLRYSALLNIKHQDALARCGIKDIDGISAAKIGHLLSVAGEHELRGQRNIGRVAIGQIRTWLAFHPNRRAEDTK